MDQILRARLDDPTLTAQERERISELLDLRERNRALERELLQDPRIRGPLEDVLGPDHEYLQP